MKTPYLDKEIKLLQNFKDNKEASFYQLRKLEEYRVIKQTLEIYCDHDELPTGDEVLERIGRKY